VNGESTPEEKWSGKRELYSKSLGGCRLGNGPSCCCRRMTRKSRPQLLAKAKNATGLSGS
jgi:hypothetical protein